MGASRGYLVDLQRDPKVPPDMGPEITTRQGPMLRIPFKPLLGAQKGTPLDRGVPLMSFPIGFRLGCVLRLPGDCYNL